MSNSSKRTVVTKQQRSEDAMKFATHAKMLRFFQVIQLLHDDKLTVDQIAEKLDLGQRMVYRYISILKYMELVDTDFEKRYFIVQDKCPICGKPPTTTNECTSLKNNN